MAAQPPSCLVSLQAAWEAPLAEVAAALLALTFGPELAKGEPYPTVSGEVPITGMLDALPETRQRGFFQSGPHVGAARQVAQEAVALLEVNLLVVRQFFSDHSMLCLTRRGHAALSAGDPAAAMTVAR